MMQMVLRLLAAALALAAPGAASAQCEIFKAHGNPNDLLGDSVGVHGDWLVYTQRQVVRVMHWTGAAWEHSSDLTFSNTVRAVDVYDDVIVAGVLGDQAIHIFRFDGTDWVLEETILDEWSPSLPGSRTLDLHGDLLVTCDPLNFPYSEAIYRYTGGQWVQEYTQVWASPTVTVATDGVRVMLGSEIRFTIYAHDGQQWDYEFAPVTLNDAGNQADISGSRAVAGRGFAYTFRACEGEDEPWCEDPSWLRPDEDLALADDVVAVSDGAQLELLRDVDGDWVAFDSLLASGADATFGDIVEMDAEWIVVGAPWDDSNGNGAGVVFVFRRDATYVAPGPPGFGIGTCQSPYDRIRDGVDALAPSRVLVAAAGDYIEAPMVISTPARITASGGLVRITAP